MTPWQINLLSLWHSMPKTILGEMPSQAKQSCGPKRKEIMTGQFYSHLNPKCDSGVFEEKGGCGVFARAFGFTTAESIRVGVGMISRGEVGLIVAGYGLANGLIGQPVFSASVIMVLVTTMVTPPLLRFTFPRRPFPGDAVVEETIGHAPRRRR